MYVSIAHCFATEKWTKLNFSGIVGFLYFLLTYFVDASIMIAFSILTVIPLFIFLLFHDLS